MAAYFEQRTSRAAVWSRRLASFSLVLMLTSAFSYRYGLLETKAFLANFALVALLALCALVLAGLAFSRVWRRGDRGGGDLTFGAIVALLVLAPFLLSAYRGFVYPPLNDISTDLDDPPALAHAARLRNADMNPIAPLTPEQKQLRLEKYPNVSGRRYDLPFALALDAVNAVLARKGWQAKGELPVAEGRGEITIEALAYTTILAFPSDVAIRLTDEGASTYVDMRSASRYGGHDLGDNAARIIGFLDELDVEIAAQADAMPVETPEEAPIPN